MNTEIVATLGPASLSLAGQLRDAGATAFRLNASHMNPEELAAAAGATRTECPGLPIVVDLQGAKVRLGRFGMKEVKPGDNLVFALEPQGTEIPLPHSEVFEVARVGDTLSSDDGRLRFRVVAAGADNLSASVLTGGVLMPRKGFNVLEHPVRLRALTRADRNAIDAVAGVSDTAFALSFMEDGREAAWVRGLALGRRVIGKIERREAVDNIAAIAAAVDSLWICRGDLGVQLGLRRMADWIHSHEPASSPVPVFMAGQVLEHLTRHREPTRSEVCHVVDLLTRGYAGFVLSDETAIGNDPVGAVRTLRALTTP
jgi:pyruvate kinase